jgi:hypothetical protein
VRRRNAARADNRAAHSTDRDRDSDRVLTHF